MNLMNLGLFPIILAAHVQHSLQDARFKIRRNFPLGCHRINFKFPLCGVCENEGRRWCLREVSKAHTILPVMRSSCSPKMVKLRESNRILLDQLESNSILLERRLKKLKRFAR